MAPTGNVLVFGDDMRVFLTIVRALGRAGKTVHAAPADPTAPALRSRYISKVHRLPPFSAGAAAWAAAVRATMERHRIDLAIPSTDPPILLLDAERQSMAGCRLAIPPVGAMEAFFDKYATHALCRELGIVSAPARCLDAGDDAQGLVREFGLPLLVKPRRSYRMDGLDDWGAAHVIDSLEQLLAVLSPIADRGQYLVEGYFAGQGGGISVLANDGEILQAFQHRRLREGKGRSSSYRISVPLHPMMLADCAKICAHTRHTGVAMFEFRDNPDSGAWILIEINARFWGSMALPLSLGLDFPNLLYDLVVLGARQPARPYRAGIRSRNLLLDAYYLATELKANGTRRSLRDAADFALQPVRWATGREFSDGFSIDDLRPGFQELATALYGRLNRFRGPPLAARRGV